MAKQHDDKKVRDQGTDRMTGDEVANAAAETLHGDRANLETHEQPDAVALPGGQTLIADEAAGDGDDEGSRVKR